MSTYFFVSPSERSRVARRENFAQFFRKCSQNVHQAKPHLEVPLLYSLKHLQQCFETASSGQIAINDKQTVT
jgi:hypothetical protein